MECSTSRVEYNQALEKFMLGEYVFDLRSLYAHLERLTDGRDRRGVRYQLADVLSLIILAKLGGEDKPRGIADWLSHRAEQLVKALKLPRESMPHQVTIGRILAGAIEPEELERLLQHYFDGQSQLSQEIVIAIDGKSLRGTIELGQSQGLHLLAAYLPAEGLVLMQVEVERKENEIVAAPKLLQTIDLRGKVVIGDAMHTQRQLSIEIVTAGGDYLWLAKDNQAQLKQDIAHLFAPQECPPATSPLPTDFQSLTRHNYGHGRYESRTITTSSMLKDYLDWPYLQQVFKLDYRSVNCKSGQVQSQTDYGLTSLAAAEAGPEQLLAFKRSYWAIENRLHYRRDVSLNEDSSRLRTGNAPRVMAILNNLVLALIDRLDFQTVPDARRRFSAKPLEALNLIFLNPCPTLQ
ncbi:MAG: ISAs1 family transposase [Anaerolineae bacterium]|nr:ISAs1 family transposase [Anaerolineae bacterium]